METILKKLLFSVLTIIFLSSCSGESSNSSTDSSAENDKKNEISSSSDYDSFTPESDKINPQTDETEEYNSDQNEIPDRDNIDTFKNEFFVAENGSDSNSGSIDNPLKIA